MPQEPPRNRRALVQLHAAVLLFGLAGLFGKFLTLAPVVIVLGRTAFASLVLGVVLIWGRETVRETARKRGAWLAASGVVLAFHWWAFFRAIQVSTVAVGLLTVSSFPVFVTLLEPLLFRERLRGRDLLTAFLVVAGVLLLVARPDWGDRTTQGAFWGVLSGLSFAGLALLNRRLVRDTPPLVIAFGQDAAATLALLPVALLSGASGPHGGRDWLLLGVLGVFCTALAHALFVASLARVRAQVASVVAGLESVYGILFAIVLLGETPRARTLAGGALILGAALLATAWPKNSHPPSPSLASERGGA